MTAVSSGPEVGAAERALLDYVDGGHERLIDLTRTLIGFKTPNPPGGNEAEAQAWVAARMEAIGMKVDVWDVLPGRPNVVGHCKATALFLLRFCGAG